MQLRRLELIGFKTFVNRTELEFHPGVTAIVGPNGSGKSNIMDAIRWALGETNARMLRGARMEDIIFSGSVSRRPHSLARVALTLDNSSGLLPLEYSEIAVSRGVTRGGDGEFGINGTDCRLRDIQMLFLGTGLGGRSYALIGQGEVDAVLRATPVERRQWLEEAAGLARHKRQRVEAERRLGHAQGHLDRLSDVLAVRILESLSETQRSALLAAMREVEGLLRASMVSFAIEDPATADARWCFSQYFAELDTRFETGFDPALSISADARELTPPAGILLLARLRGRAVGCPRDGIGQSDRHQVSACWARIWRLVLPQGHVGTDQNRSRSGRAAAHRRGGCADQ